MESRIWNLDQNHLNGGFSISRKTKKEGGVMEVEALVKGITQYGVFAALFFWILRYVLKENEKRDVKSEEREEWLRKHLENAQNINAETVGTLKLMNLEIKNDLADIKEILKKE